METELGDIAGVELASELCERRLIGKHGLAVDDQALLEHAEADVRAFAQEMAKQHERIPRVLPGYRTGRRVEPHRLVCDQ